MKIELERWNAVNFISVPEISSVFYRTFEWEWITPGGD